MLRILNFVFLALMIVGAAVTYDMKHKAEKAATTVARLEARIEREREAMQLLRAEHSMLVQPARLQAVVERHADHFRLETFSPTQYATLDEIPFRPDGRAGGESIADIIGDTKSAVR